MVTILYDMSFPGESNADQKKRLEYLRKQATEGYIFLDDAYRCGEVPKNRQDAFDVFRADKADLFRVQSIYNLCACWSDIPAVYEAVKEQNITITFQEAESKAVWKIIEAVMVVYGGFMKRQTGKATAASRHLVDMGAPKGIRNIEKAKKAYTQFIKNRGKEQRKSLKRKLGFASWQTYYTYIRVGATLFADSEEERDPFNSDELLKDNVPEAYWNKYYKSET